jgi:ferric-dicitrate binding protein FerR (iron transport regulator)
VLLSGYLLQFPYIYLGRIGMLIQAVPVKRTETRIIIMRRPLPSTRRRHLGALAVLAAIVALATIGLSAQAGTTLQPQSHSTTAR